MNSTNRSEPVGWTCPLIDGIQRDLTAAREAIVAVLDVARDALAPGLVDRLDNAIAHLDDVEGVAEDVRTANDKLRRWGNALVGDLETADGIVGDLERELADARDQIPA